MQVHLVDGTYELFRQYLAPRPGHQDKNGVEVGGTRAVVSSMIGTFLTTGENPAYPGAARVAAEAER